MGEWLSERKAVEYTSLSRETLRQARNGGRLTFYQFGKKVLYQKEDLDNYIRSSSQKIFIIRRFF
ncbi:helix-turn-helix domain-containing protein [Dysgonomonas massiliensis]|uniref:helix-turn-helix domain-containing protein n=1 Tax=Dysgonomonas massiliensis TaxID=2040292 RepID=UPI000C77B29B